MAHLVQVPVKAELTEIEEFLIDNLKDFGIIAGGFAAYLYNPEKRHTDIDLFVNEKLDSDIYDRIHTKLAGQMGFMQKLTWRIHAKHPAASRYDPNSGLQGLDIFDWKKKAAAIAASKLQMPINPNWICQLQVVSRVEQDGRHASAESILKSFDWNVCKAVVLDKKTLLVDPYFIEDMKENRLSTKPYPLQGHQGDYGWRFIKYIDHKGYKMSFKEMLATFAQAPDQIKFFDQLIGTKNEDLQKLINFIMLMKSHAPEWQAVFQKHKDFGDF